MIKNSYSLFLFLILIFAVPLPQYWLGASSFMSGTLIVIMIFLISNGLLTNMKIKKNAFDTLNISISFLLIHFLLVFFIWGRGDFYRGILSIVLMYVFLFSAYYFSKMIVSLSDNSLIRIVNMIIIIFIFSFIGNFIPEIQNSNNVKPILPFNEPSHYALFGLPFLFFKILSTHQIKYKLIYILGALLIALLLRNLTMICGVLLFAAITLRLKSIYFILFIAVIFPIISLNFDFSYYLNRLNFKEENNNLSTLVFIQGWQLAFESLKTTFGLGLGFQQLGFFPISTSAGDIIFKLLKKEVNVTDAGLTAPKIISELGIVGVILITVYLKYAIKIFNEIMNTTNLKVLFAYSIYITFFLDLFVRGIGYFNPPFFLFVSSIFILKFYRDEISI